MEIARIYTGHASMFSQHALGTEETGASLGDKEGGGPS